MSIDNLNPYYNPTLKRAKVFRLFTVYGSRRLRLQHLQCPVQGAKANPLLEQMQPDGLNGISADKPTLEVWVGFRSSKARERTRVAKTVPKQASEAVTASP